MADGRDGSVVRLGIERAHAGAQRLPELRDPLEGAELGPLRRSHDDGGAAEEVGAGDAVAALLGARERVAADEGKRAPGGEALGRAHDVALRRPHVGDHRPVGRRAPHPLQQPLDRQDRRRQQDEIGLAHARFELDRRDVERSIVDGRLQPGDVTPDADDPTGEPAGSRRFRHGAAEQADADDRELLDHAGLFPSPERSAFTSLRFSSGVPTVIRSAVSSPKGVIGRTITPWWSSFW